MSRNTSFGIGEHFSSFVEIQVKEGRYGSAGDVVRAGLRLLQEREATLAAPRAATVEGEQSGVSSRSIRDIRAAIKQEGDAARG